VKTEYLTVTCFISTGNERPRPETCLRFGRLRGMIHTLNLDCSDEPVSLLSISIQYWVFVC